MEKPIGRNALFDNVVSLDEQRKRHESATSTTNQEAEQKSDNREQLCENGTCTLSWRPKKRTAA